MNGGQFTRELRLMMYGSGDAVHPRDDSVAVVEELMLDYVLALCSQALRVAQPRGRAVKLEDLLFALRKDDKKLARAEELLYRFEELQRARKAFDATADSYA